MFSHNGIIIGEDRNTETKTVTFFSLDASNGKPLWKDKTFNEQWWIGLDAVTDNRLFLHGFKKPDMPEHKNIIAVDLKSGEILWKNNECTFLAIRSPFVIGYKDLFERRVYYRIEENSGTTIEELQSLPDGVDANTQYEKTDFTFPTQLSESEESLWKSAQAIESFQSAEFIATEKHAMFNLYTKHADVSLGLKNTLYVIDTSTKKKVYSDILNGSTLYPVPDSFFLDGKTIYYIKERKTFVALLLPE